MPVHDKPTLLLLGGARFQVPAIETANRLGYRTVLCDYLLDNPGQHVADVYYPLSTTDYQAVLGVARREGISGVLSFGSDVAAPVASAVAAELGLPGNPFETVQVLSDKRLFRAYLEEHGFPCPKHVSFPADVEASSVMGMLEGFRMPIMVKPTDSSGSKGITTLSSLSETALTDALELADSFSRNKKLIIEEFISSPENTVIGGDIFVYDGKVRFWGLMRCIRDQRMGGLVPVGKMFPSGLDETSEARVREGLQKLVTSIGFRFGEMNVEVIVGFDGTPYIIELAGRAGGNFIPEQLGMISGVDLIEANVRCAMGMEPGDIDFSSGGKPILSAVLHSITGGTLRSITYDGAFKDAVCEEHIYFKPGDVVPPFRNAADAIGVCFFAFDTEEEMFEAFKTVNDQVVVLVS